MAGISVEIFNFSESLFKRVGLGNNKFLVAMGIAILFSLMAIAGFYFPLFATTISLLLPLLLSH